MMIGLPAHAQVDVDQVHIRPRTSPRSQPATVLRTQVGLVLVNVTVLDRRERTVTDLPSRAFTVLDNNRPQSIQYLSHEDAPLSAMVIFDASASMRPRIQAARDAVEELINRSNPADEFGLIVVNSEPHLRLDFADPVEEIRFATGSILPDGFTALWDGVYLAVQRLLSARYPRKAIIVISDGGDNRSCYTESEVKFLLEESEAELYAIGTFARFPKKMEERRGPMQLDDLASVTGGRLFSVLEGDDIRPAAAQISRELRDQYVLGYYASRRDRDGRWHKLSIHLTNPPAVGKLRLYAKKGYYAPAP